MKNANPTQKRIGNGATEACPKCDEPVSGSFSSEPTQRTMQPCGCVVPAPVATDGGRPPGFDDVELSIRTKRVNVATFIRVFEMGVQVADEVNPFSGPAINVLESIAKEMNEEYPEADRREDLAESFRSTVEDGGVWSVINVEIETLDDPDELVDADADDPDDPDDPDPQREDVEAPIADGGREVIEIKRKHGETLLEAAGEVLEGIANGRQQWGFEEETAIFDAGELDDAFQELQDELRESADNRHEYDDEELATDGGQEIEVRRYGPYLLSGTDRDGGRRLFIHQDALDESGLDPDGSVLAQPYENGIHLINAANATITDGGVSVSDVSCPNCHYSKGNAEEGTNLCSECGQWFMVAADGQASTAGEPAVADGGREREDALRAEWWELTTAQQALLLAIPRVSASDEYEATNGLKIRSEAESDEWFGEKLSNGRLYPSLNALVERNLLEKSMVDANSYSWELTERGRQLITAHQSQVMESLSVAWPTGSTATELALTAADIKGGR